MTQWILITCDKRQFALPEPISWELQYGLGSPCDSFQLLCPWVPGQEGALEDGVRINVRHEGALIFCGVVDEWECLLQEGGGCLTIHGRGMQALLLDNEAAGAEFGVATLEDILRHYVTPYGITLAEPAKLPSVSGFSVQTGSSCWQVLDQFARYHGGIRPRFTKEGKLLLTPWREEGELCIDDATPVTRLLLRHKRYGVLSQVKVVNRVSLASSTVVNEAFRSKGGCASRVLTMPRTSSYQTLRYNGQYQLDQSRAQLRQVELTVAAPFMAWPGQLVKLQRTGWGGGGSYRVVELSLRLGSGGYETCLVLADPAALG